MLEFIVAFVMSTADPNVDRHLSIATPPYVQTMDDCKKFAARVAEDYMKQGQGNVKSIRCIQK